MAFNLVRIHKRKWFCTIYLDWPPSVQLLDRIAEQRPELVIIYFFFIVHFTEIIPSSNRPYNFSLTPVTFVFEIEIFCYNPVFYTWAPYFLTFDDGTSQDIFHILITDRAKVISLYFCIHSIFHLA